MCQMKNTIVKTRLSLSHTIELIKDLRRYYHKKRDRLPNIKKSVVSIVHKSYAFKSNIYVNYDKSTNILEIQGNKDIIDELIFSINYKDVEIKLFGPLIYYLVPNLGKVGRMVAYKKINDCSMFLVHRSNRSGYPLDHPGGHIEYLEFKNIIHSNNQSIYSAKKYLVLMINNMSQKPICYHVLNKNIVRWILCGTMREVIEEAGIDLFKYWNKTDLIRVGTRTFYFSAMIDSGDKESGPMEKYKNEILTKHTNLFSNPAPNTITESKQRFIHNMSYNNNADQVSLDQFWEQCVDHKTYHAWVSSCEMRLYWDDRYIYYIDDVINKHSWSNNVSK